MLELEPVTPPPAPAEPVTPEPPPAPVDPDEAQAIEVQGGKMVPLAALKAAREEAKAAKETASRVTQLEQELAAAKPYEQFVKANPSLLQPQVPAAPPPGADPELVELAQSLDYYKADGTPDTTRAAKHQTIIRREASKMAQQMVAPVAQSHAQAQSNANYAVVVHEKLPNGQPLDQRILNQMWASLPVDQTANPAVAALVRDLTIAAQLRQSPLPPNPAPPSQPPVHTEHLGTTVRRTTQMTPTERGVAQQRGMSDEKYSTLTKDFTPGRMNPLED